jgi:hypothetical protein
LAEAAWPLVDMSDWCGGWVEAKHD